MIRRSLERRRFKREHRWTHSHLSEFLDRDLDDSEQHRLHEHVGICPQCRRVLATLRRTIEGLRGLGSSEAQQRPDPAVVGSVIERFRDEP